MFDRFKTLGANNGDFAEEQSLSFYKNKRGVIANIFAPHNLEDS